MTKKRIVSQSSHVDDGKAGKKAEAGTGKVYRGTLEAEWTCSSCGREHIPGGTKRCPGCGNPKDASEEYQAPAAKSDYLTEDELAERGVDAEQHLSDEACPYCGARLKPGTQKCPNCGAPLADVGYTTRQCPNCGSESTAETCPNCGAPTVPKAAVAFSGPQIDDEPEPKPKPKPKDKPFYLQTGFIVVAIAGAAALCLIACLLAIALYPHSETATVDSLSWTRTIHIEEHQYNQHSDWSLPAGADLVDTEERVHHYDQVLIGYEEECGTEQSCTNISVYDHTETTCYDDGTCDEHDVYRTEQECTDEYVCKDVPQYVDEPVYQTWYTYNVWEWVEIEPAVAQGNDAEPRWPQLNLADDQREKPDGREEKCTVTFSNDKGATYDYYPPCDSLAQYPEGSVWRIKRNAMRVKDVEPIR